MAKMFEKSLMASEDVQSLLYSGIFYVDDAEAECHNGAIVARGDMLEDIYGNPDPNLYKIAAPEAATDEVGVVDFVGVSNGDIMGENYREGIKTYGLSAEAGRAVRVRKLMKGDTGYFSAENIVGGTANDGDFVVATAGSTLLTAKASLTNDDKKGTYGVVRFAKPIVEGTVETGTKYFVEFINVI